MAKNYVNMQTPFGVAKYPSLDKPDTFGAKEGEGKYKLKIVVTKEELAKFKADFIAKVGPIPKGHKVPWAEKDGEWILSAASKRKPAVFDLKKMPIAFEQGESLGGGSLVRANVTVGTYTGGFNLYLNGVQVKKLVTKGSFDADSMFDDVEDDELETADALDL